MMQKVIWNSYNTIDIDTTDKETIFYTVSNILNMNRRFHCLAKIYINPSSLKGYHIKLYCKKKCDICRMVFDDDIRYFYDQFREIESQNVLCQTTESFLLKKEDFKI
jgi:hypothetical protein